MGEVAAMGVLFNYTRSMSYEDAFAVASLINLVFGFFFLFAVKDPDMKSLRKKIDLKLQSTDKLNKYEKRDFESQSIFTKTINLSKLVYHELIEKPILTLCIIGACLTRLISVLFSTFLILWI